MDNDNSGYHKLKSKASLKEILQVATEFERTARDFYQDMISKVSKNIRYLVEELATEEQHHLDLFTQLSTHPEIEKQIMEMVEIPANDSRFSDCIHVPELGEKPDDQAILQYALMREHAAIEQYSALAKTTPSGEIQSLFKFLANEETKHKNELEKIYYEIVHSGGV
jgi:rubrerythrin